jgi:hypothetical protein
VNSSTRLARVMSERGYVLRAQHALSEAELSALVERCPAGQRWAFEGWLRGERSLDGDLVGDGVDLELENDH